MGPPGHFAVGLVAKRFAPKAPLWLLLLASILPDILGFGFRLVGIEHYDGYTFNASLGTFSFTPQNKVWSHGLFMTFVWAALAGALVYLIWRDRRTSGMVGLAVLSHWVFDFLVHPPDMPLLFADSPKVGLGLWSTQTGFWVSVLLESILFGGGLAVYLLSRKAARRKEASSHSVGD